MKQLQNLKNKELINNFRYQKEHSSELTETAKSQNIQIKFSYAVIAANGYKKVKSALIGKLNRDKTDFKNSETIECDCICVSGLDTTVHLASQSGNKLKFNDQIDAFVPNKSKASVGASKVLLQRNFE